MRIVLSETEMIFFRRKGSYKRYVFPLHITATWAFTTKKQIRRKGKGKVMIPSFKQRAEWLHCSLIVIHIECDQWQPSFTWEKLTCVTEISVTKKILQKFPNNLQCTNSVYQALFSPPSHKNLGSRLVKYESVSVPLLQFCMSIMYNKRDWR